MGNYPDFIKTTGYGDVAGLCGANCRHSFGPYIEGITPETYSAEMLDEFANAKVKYKDKEIPYYEATQIQRKLERNLRNSKSKLAIKAAAELDTTKEKESVKEWRRKLKEFCDETGLDRDPPRERIAKQSVAT